ncbi:hypothetical protein BGZ68_008263 [Mortierella alpina]|nr:hypothetical protein BGZ68_008263 [Mortierella alpina]
MATSMCTNTLRQYSLHTFIRRNIITMSQSIDTILCITTTLIITHITLTTLIISTTFTITRILLATAINTAIITSMCMDTLMHTRTAMDMHTDMCQGTLICTITAIPLHQVILAMPPRGLIHIVIQNRRLIKRALASSACSSKGVSNRPLISHGAGLRFWHSQHHNHCRRVVRTGRQV